jgi:cytochrome c oxidase cbb3-type subunit 3
MNRAAAAALVLTVLACGQERRDYRTIPPGASATDAVPMSELQPGGAVVVESTKSSYGSNAYALAEGMKLYQRMNCVGCHFHGGGGIGPPLIDAEWVYGSDPSQIFRTIVEGRPNGMPSFKRQLTNQEVWRLVAYVRSLSGLDGTTVSSSRQDHMYLSPNVALQNKEQLKGETIKRP